MWTSLGTKPVAALTELLYANLTGGGLHIPVILELVDHQCQHLGHCVIHTLHPAIGIWMVRAGGNFPHAKKFVDRLQKL